jgi:hypothetical protein
MEFYSNLDGRNIGNSESSQGFACIVLSMEILYDMNNILEREGA